MRRELSARLGDDELDLAVEPDGSGKWRLVIAGRETIVDAREVRPGTWSLIVDGRSHLVDLARTPRGTVVGNRVSDVLLEIDDARRRRLASAVQRDRGRDAGEVVRAPIAGKVVKVLVEVDQVVAAGQGVAVLEAMKMENEIKADRGGKVATVHVRPGQSVDTQEPLVTLG
jgi:biotin carboxyl carrier protein